MYLETFVMTQQLSKNKNKIEKYSVEETWDIEICLTFIIYFLWIFLWVMTIRSAIFISKKGAKNSSAALVISVLSWPFYWIFKMSGCFGNK